MRVFVTTNLGEEFKKFVLNKLRGPKVAAMLTWFSPSGHEKLRPACCWAAESLMGKHRGFESVVNSSSMRTYFEDFLAASPLRSTLQSRLVRFVAARSSCGYSTEKSVRGRRGAAFRGSGGGG